MLGFLLDGVVKLCPRDLGFLHTADGGANGSAATGGRGSAGAAHYQVLKVLKAENLPKIKDEFKCRLYSRSLIAVLLIYMAAIAFGFYTRKQKITR